MKKYFLLFAGLPFFCISHSFAQSQAKTGKEQSAVVNTDSVSSSHDTTPRGTISRAGKNQQSVYTPPADAGNNTPASGTQPSSSKAQPAIIDPKKQY
ncbi:MAG: hypothetical protein JWP12_3850 [Bacteroidetes bacterium]|nr:hypothetical protein [Bacteroidota bacterium]